MSERVRLLLIDDHPLMRKGLGELLDATDDFRVVGSAACSEDGIELAARLEPQMILLDLHMPGMGGLAALGQLKRVVPNCCLVVLTASDDREDLLAALRAGADGYLLKDSEPESLLAYLKNCCLGQVSLDASLTRQLTEPPVAAERRMADSELTERERQTLVLIAEGMSNKLIARQLGISDGTVKTHVKHLLSKLNLHSRLELAAWAHRAGFLERHGHRDGD